MKNEELMLEPVGGFLLFVQFVAVTLFILSHIIIVGVKTPKSSKKRIEKKGYIYMNCFCDLFQNEVVWLIIIALIILFAVCGNGFGCGGCGGC